MDPSSPIGVFDSGIGGISVWNRLVEELPGESLIYIADQEHAPYGTKSRKFITSRSRFLTKTLARLGCKMVVVACNTATGASISTLRKEFGIPFIGVEPAIKPAAEHSRSGHVGVLATVQTFRGEHFRRSADRFAGSVRVHEAAGTGLVELIEEGRADSAEARALLETILKPMVDSGIDQLVLGCTHYPFLIPLIREIVPAYVNVIDPAPAVAAQARRVLEASGLLNRTEVEPRYRFFTTGDPARFSGMLERLTGRPIPAEKL